MSNGWHPNPLERERRALAAWKARVVQLKINFTDAEYECPTHGRLPLDRNKPADCARDCWPPEAIKALGSRRQENLDHSDA